MNGLIEIGIDQDVSWSTNEWIHWIGRDGLDSWVVVPINVTEEVNCNFSDTLSDGGSNVVIVSRSGNGVQREKAFCELSFAKSLTVVTVEREFRSRPPRRVIMPPGGHDPQFEKPCLNLFG
ncbi:hypothetical protein TNCV_201721 [Trichonephila clavipes]|nr:hypothetical protein TNCV_201721 [Trichonephila clavipes]